MHNYQYAESNSDRDSQNLDDLCNPIIWLLSYMYTHIFTHADVVPRLSD